MPVGFSLELMLCASLAPRMCCPWEVEVGLSHSDLLKNWWLEDYCTFHFGKVIFSGGYYVKTSGVVRFLFQKNITEKCCVFLVAPLSFEHQRFKMTTRVDQTKNGQLRQFVKTGVVAKEAALCMEDELLKEVRWRLILLPRYPLPAP